MRTKMNYAKTAIIFIVLLFIAGQSASAQGQTPLTAKVDRTSLSTGETLTLTVTVRTLTMNTPQPTLPSLEGFNVVGSSTASQISIINGAMTGQTTYSYRLQPYQTGDLVIGSISLTLDGQTYTTEPITIRVNQGTGGQAQPTPSHKQTAPPPTELRGQDFFAEAEVDNPDPYLGQQIVYTFRFYRAIGTFNSLLDRPHYSAPAFTGFWNKQQPDQSQYEAQIQGQPYQVTELQTILFPTTVGTVTIEPARVIIPGGFFHPDSEVSTEPITLAVHALPPSAPADFSGAVGQFTLTAETDTTQGKVNEPITLRVTLSGQGNLETLPDPTWPDMPGWRTFDSQATINTQVQAGQTSGSRVYERLLVPTTEGDFTLPAITYTYFDPVAAEYRTLTTEPIPVSVAPGAATAPTTVYVGGNKEVVEQLATDIRYLKPVPPTISPATSPLTEQRIYWLAWGLPLLALTAHFGWQWRQSYWQNNRSLARSSQARGRAIKALAQARKGHQDPYAAAAQILATYLADKLNQPVAGLTHKALANLLASRGVNLDLVSQVEACLATSELRRFSPDEAKPVHGENLLKEVDTLIDNLEKVF